MEDHQMLEEHIVRRRRGGRRGRTHKSWWGWRRNTNCWEV